MTTKLNMTARVVAEAGYDAALLGLSLSHNAKLDRMPKVAERLAPLDKGHNKVLESICVWLDVQSSDYDCFEMPSRKFTSLPARVSLAFISHSQTTSTAQFIASSSLWFCASRLTLPANFFFQ